MERILKSDLMTKLLAVFIAFALWGYVVNEENPLVPMPVKAVVINVGDVAPGYTVTDFEPKTVDIKIRGRRDLIERLNRADFNAYVELKGLGPGEQTVPVKVTAPYGVQVVEVNPDTTKVRLDVLVKRDVPVEVRLQGVPHPEYLVAGTTIRPQRAIVDGPAAFVSQVVKVTGEVEVSNAAGDIARAVPLRAVDSRGAEVKGVTVIPGLVEVNVSIQKLPPGKELPVRAEIRGQPASGFSVRNVRISPDVVLVRGSQEFLEGLRFATTEPIDIEGSASNIHREVTVIVPDGAMLISPSRVSVAVELVQS